MLDSFKNKTVKLLVSSDSSISTSTSVAGNSTISSLIQVFGKLVDFDDDFIQLETASIVYYNNSHTSSSLADSEQTSSIIINRDKIICISLK